MKCQKCKNLEKFFENPIPFEQKFEIAMQFEQHIEGFCPDCENLDNFVDDSYFENN